MHLAALVSVERRVLEHIDSTENAIQRRTDFMTHDGEKFAACIEGAIELLGAFLHALLQLHGGIALNAIVLGLEHGQSVGQRKRQQPGFQCAADFEGMVEHPVAVDQTEGLEHKQRRQHGDGQEGEQEITCRSEAVANTHKHGAEHDRGEQDDSKGGDLQGHLGGHEPGGQGRHDHDGAGDLQ